MSRLWHMLRRAAFRTWSSFARRQAERELSLELAEASDAVLEQCRDAQGWPLIAALRQDVRYALRRIRRQPGFSLVVMATLALGIGATTGIFALWNGLMLRPLPVRDPGSLLLLQWQARHFPHFTELRFGGDCVVSTRSGAAHGCSFSPPYFASLSARPEFASLAAYQSYGRIDLAWHGEPVAATSQLVTGGYFSTLGITPAAGRLLTPADDAPEAEAAVVLSYRFWHDAWGGAPGIVGAHITLNGKPAQVVGVASAAFTALSPGNPQDVWVPLHLLPQLEFTQDKLNGSPRFATVTIVGRLAHGVSRAQGAAAAGLLWSQAMLAGPKPMLAASDAPTVTLTPAGQAFTGSRTTYAQPLLLMLAAVGMILLLACVNVAGLMLARGGTRTQEIALRRALGASQGRVFRQLLTESLVLAGGGALAGIAVAYGCARGIAAAVAAGTSQPLPVPSLWDHRVLGFTLAAALLAGTLSGVWPARAASRGADVRMGPRAFGWATAQVALSAVILVCTALLVRTLQRVEATDMGFDTSHLITFGVNPGGLGFGGAARDALFTGVRERLRALPGVESAGSSMAPLLSPALTNGYSMQMLHDPHGGAVLANELSIGPGYLQTLGLPLLAGRLFTDADLSTPDTLPQPTVISRQLAVALYGAENPVGRKIGRRGIVIGEVSDAKFASVRAAATPAMYIPYQNATAYFTVRSPVSLGELLPAIRHAVAEVNPNLPVFDARSEATNVAQITFQERMLAALTGGLGVLALLLACLGLYGILAHDVTRRQRELGVRMALGATGASLARGVVARGMIAAALGLVIGAAVAWPCTQALHSFLYGVAPSDPIAWSAAFALLLAVAVLASIAPARRALTSDPAEVLRSE